jgi:hypothetical protein
MTVHSYCGAHRQDCFWDLVAHTIVVGHPAKGRGKMPILMIRCPNTGQAVPTGIETDAMWKREASLAVDGIGELPREVVGPKLKKQKRPSR